MSLYKQPGVVTKIINRSKIQWLLRSQTKWIASGQIRSRKSALSKNPRLCKARLLKKKTHTRKQHNQSYSYREWWATDRQIEGAVGAKKMWPRRFSTWRSEVWDRSTKMRNFTFWCSHLWCVCFWNLSVELLTNSTAANSPSKMTIKTFSTCSIGIWVTPKTKILSRVCLKWWSKSHHHLQESGFWSWCVHLYSTSPCITMVRDGKSWLPDSTA